MKRTALIFLIVVCGPSLVLAWLALRSVRDQQFVLERQQALVYAAAADSLATDINRYLAELLRSFRLEVDSSLLRTNASELATTFDDLLPARWPLANNGFAVSPDGQILSPSPQNNRQEAQQFLNDNGLFLGNRETVPVFANLDPLPPAPTSSADNPQESSSRQVMRSRYGLKSSPQQQQANPRQVEPQQQAQLPFANPSRSIPTDATFRDLLARQTEGTVARYVQNRLNLIFWTRPQNHPDLILGASINLQRLAEELRPLIADALTNEKPAVCVALLDDSARPVALSKPGFSAPWKRPFVAAEIGETLPHWEIAFYLVDPAWSGRYARNVVFTLAPTIALLVFAIVAGSWLIVRELHREVALARQKTDFVSNVSHELKTPLTSIRMFAELLAEGRVTDPARQRDYLGIITAEAARLTRLINNVLDFSRLERGQKLYNFQPCDLTSLASETCETLRPHLAQNGYSCELDLPETPVLIHADRDALAQVLLNLLSNAEKYGGDPKSIRLELRHLHQPLPHAELLVLDRGPGVPHGCEEKIFEKFYRAHDALNSGIQGSGLGLTLARQIARAHGGDLTCSPRPDGGTCFSLRLPTPPPSHS